MRYVPVGPAPVAVTVNTLTDEVFIANSGSDTVTVMDGTFGFTRTISVRANPTVVAVNAGTNRIYVAGAGNEVTVIDGATDQAEIAATGADPVSTAADPVSGNVYVTYSGSNSVGILRPEIDETYLLSGGLARAFATDPVRNVMYAGTGQFIVAIDGASFETSYIPVGTVYDLALNPVTGRVYAATGPNVAEYDPGTGEVNFIPVAGVAVAVDEVSNRIFALDDAFDVVAIIDGTTHAITQAPVGGNPNDVEVDSSTGLAYVSNNFDSTVSVIDGATGSVTNLPVGFSPKTIAINRRTDRVYVICDGTVTVIDGEDNSTVSVPVGPDALAIAINSVMNRVYIADRTLGNVTVIDGVTNETSTMAVDSDPISIAVNEVTNQIYVGHYFSEDVAVIDGVTGHTHYVWMNAIVYALGVNPVSGDVGIGTNAALVMMTPIQRYDVPLTTTIVPLPDNVTDGDSATLTLIASNSSIYSSPPPPTGIYFQLDTQQGPWRPATLDPAGDSYSVTLNQLGFGPHILYAYAVDGQDSTNVNAGPQSAPLTGKVSAYGFVRAPDPNLVQHETVFADGFEIP